MRCVWTQISISKKQKNLTEMGVWTRRADVLAHGCVACSCGWWMGGVDALRVRADALRADG